MKIFVCYSEICGLGTPYVIVIDIYLLNDFSSEHLHLSVKIAHGIHRKGKDGDVW